MNPEAIAAALASSEANHAALVSRAASLAGEPAERDAWARARDAHRISRNLRELLATTDRRDGAS